MFGSDVKWLSQTLVQAWFRSQLEAIAELPKTQSLHSKYEQEELIQHGKKTVSVLMWAVVLKQT